MYSAVKNYEGMVSTLAGLQIKTSKIVVSKIVVTGANIDAFMKGFKCAECGGCEHLICMAVDLDDANIMAANQAGVEYLKRFEEEVLAKVPEPLGG
jgi:hypothetical protein